MKYDNLRGKKVLVLGLSVSGTAAAKCLNRHGADVWLSEYSQADNLSQKETIENLKNLGIKVETGGHSDEFIENSQLVVTSPSVPQDSPIMKELTKKGIEVISEVELASKLTTKPFIAITGTNGKTTTTALTAHILNSEYVAEPCGNYGKPPCDLVDNSDIDYFVCECSSFQLAYSPEFRPKISVFTNFTPDHITWHKTLENYFGAKARIFKSKQAPEYAVLNAKDEKLKDFAKQLNTTVFFFGDELGENCSYVKDGVIFFKQNGVEEKIIDLKDCPFIGEHNWQNAECAIICAKLEGISSENIKKSIMSFEVPEHRLEKFAMYNGITFYNDSKATNPEASLVAIKSFNDKDVVLIAGGRDKLTDLTEFCEAVKEHISTVILIGEATERFEESLIKQSFTNIIKEKSMERSVERAIKLKPDVVLLSPACASFDMFSGYEERGKVFKADVLSKIGKN